MPMPCMLQVGMGSSSFEPVLSSSAAGVEVVAGHCSVGLELLCQVALLASGGVSGSVTVPRILLRDGLPLHRVDPRSLQVRRNECSAIQPFSSSC